MAWCLYQLNNSLTIHIGTFSAVSAQIWSPQMRTRAFLMVIYIKKLCYAASRGQMDLKTTYPNCRHNFGRTRPLARLQGLVEQNKLLWGKIFIFVICSKQIFLRTTIFGVTKRFVGNCPRMPNHVCGPGQNRRQKVFHWGHSCLWRGARHSENLFLSQNMNSICRLCKLHYKYFPANTHGRLVVCN